MRRGILAAVATTMVMAVAGCVASPTASRLDPPQSPATQSPATQSTAPQSPATQSPATSAPASPRLLGSVPLVGVYEPDAPGSWSDFGAFASASGIRPGIAGYYSSWREPFGSAFAETAWNHGAYVLVQLQPNGVSLASIADGDSDAYLRSFADAVAAFGHPVILSFGHEMNGSWYSWGDGHASAAEFIAAWRHIVGVFRAQGADNATWLWAVNSVAGASGDLRRWWPGAAWVNWVGVDGYYFGTADTFTSVFGPTIADIRAFSQAPLLIAETAVGTTADRDSQIKGLFAGVREQRLAGLMWFDEAQDSGLYHQDWRLEDDPSALAAFAAGAADGLVPG
ncbi:MAG TPA: glycosyl hydrolase [Trebonia sp.]|nr:glycosyl hydrolase [Trebonia sp.]